MTLTGTTMQLNFIVGNNFNKLLGYNQQTYPTNPSVSLENFNSETKPQISEVITVNINCNLVYNPIQQNRTILFFIADQSYGEYITVEPSIPLFLDITDGSFNNITLQFVDQTNNRIVELLDNDISVHLLIKDK